MITGIMACDDDSDDDDDDGDDDDSDDDNDDDTQSYHLRSIHECHIITHSQFHNIS